MDPAVLRRAIAGECTPEEQQLVDSWAAESEQRRRYLGALAALYNRASADDARAAADSWDRILERMEPPDSVEDPAYVPPWEEPATHVDVRRRHRSRILAGAFRQERSVLWPIAAAAAAVTVAVGGLRVAGGLDSHPVPRPPAAMRQIITATGQRAEIRLDDGSRVVLGVASRLKLPGDFGVRNREVYLEGTAYFDVVHDSARPFVVRTANAETRDVGTRFVVSSYPESHGTRVVVRDGAVALGTAEPAGHPDHSVLLTGGSLGRLRSGDSVATTRRVDPELYTAWMQGDLVFQDEPLSDAVAELRRWYDVDIRIGDPSMRKMPISAAFAAESLHEALSVVTTVLPLRAVRRGNVVTLYRRPQ